MSDQEKQQLMVWWVLWAAFQAGVFFFHHFLGRESTPPQSPAAPSTVYMAGLAPAALSTIIRWLVLPRRKNAQTALPVFVVGMAMAETTCFLGLFVFPSHDQQLCMLSAFGILQFIPFFARRYFPQCDQDRRR